MQNRRIATLSVLLLLLTLAPSSVFAQRDPFKKRVPAPDFPQGLEWLNVEKPLQLKGLRGKFVLLDFWTYCCINCMHVLPELKKLEQEFDKQLVVIGVHSAKFEAEKDSSNITDAILRYEIEHPVVNDNRHQIWQTFGIRSWPSTLLIDPEGNVVFGKSGEFKAEEYATVLKAAISFYRKRGSLKESTVEFELLSNNQPKTQLRFPGKVLADEASDRLFISDSNHNRIVVTDLKGKLQTVIGSGEIGSKNADFATSTFNHPQGMALRGNKLYVADTENHLLREIDFDSGKVKRIAGTGKQAKNGFPGFNPQTSQQGRRPWSGKPTRTALASPWALQWQDDKLLIAMAGTHQIWIWNPVADKIGPFAGNGREDIVDGPLLPSAPYGLGASSFAQPSGLTSDGKWLYVADSEGSSVRAVPISKAAGKSVRTVVGTAELPQARLFTFGDTNGNLKVARLQHALGVSSHGSMIYVADTYNNKIKVIDLNEKVVRDIAGDGQPGKSDDPPRFDEPSGLSFAANKIYVADTNNHAIRVIDVSTNAVSGLKIKDLAAPTAR